MWAGALSEPGTSITWLLRVSRRLFAGLWRKHGDWHPCHPVRQAVGYPESASRLIQLIKTPFFQFWLQSHRHCFRAQLAAAQVAWGRRSLRLQGSGLRKKDPGVDQRQMHSGLRLHLGRQLPEHLRRSHVFQRRNHYLPPESSDGIYSSW